MSSLSTSIAMTTYNGAAYLDEQLRSLADQTRLPDELVICDDQSTDATLSIAQRFASDAPFKVHVHSNPARLGIAGNFARAISLCCGDVILLCDQDDRWHREKVACFAGVFEEQSGVGLVCCDARVMDERMRPLGFTAWQSVGLTASMQEQINRGNAFETFLAHCPIAGACIGFRAHFREVFLPMPELLAYDQWIIQIIAAVADCKALREPLNEYRQHPKQRLGVKSQSLWQWATARRRMDPGHFRYLAGYLDMLQERLIQTHSKLTSADYLAIMACKARFLRSRARMRDNRWLKLPLIFQQLALLNYFKFSRGWITVGRDLWG